RHRAIRFVFETVLGLGVADTSKIYAQHFKGKVEGEALISACVSLIGSYEEPEQAFMDFFSRSFGSMVSPDKIALTSNCIPAAKLGATKLVPGARSVAVIRDPRDQFAAQFYEC